MQFSAESQGLGRIGPNPVTDGLRPGGAAIADGGIAIAGVVITNHRIAGRGEVGDRVKNWVRAQRVPNETKTVVIGTAPRQVPLNCHVPRDIAVGSADHHRRAVGIRGQGQVASGSKDPVEGQFAGGGNRARRSQGHPTATDGYIQRPVAAGPLGPDGSVAGTVDQSARRPVGDGSVVGNGTTAHGQGPVDGQCGPRIHQKCTSAHRQVVEGLVGQNAQGVGTYFGGPGSDLKIIQPIVAAAARGAVQG